MIKSVAHSLHEERVAWPVFLFTPSKQLHGKSRQVHCRLGHYLPTPAEPVHPATHASRSSFTRSPYLIEEPCSLENCPQERIVLLVAGHARVSHLRLGYHGQQ